MSDKKDRPTRQHEHQLWIDASPEVVWQAITSPEELTRWFPLRAEADLRQGGSITYGWRDDIVGTCEIRQWQPPRHLQTSWMTGASGDADPMVVAVDWYLEGAGGGTQLRLVHSGFGRDADWDEEFEGSRRGWIYELGSLKHYLEHHRGRDRKAFWVCQPVSGSAWDGWNALDDGSLLVDGVRFSGQRPGDRFHGQLGGEAVTGIVRWVAPPREFTVTLDRIGDDRVGDALLRLGCENCGAGLEAHIWFSAWDLPAERVAELERLWGNALRSAFEG